MMRLSSLLLCLALTWVASPADATKRVSAIHGDVPSMEVATLVSEPGEEWTPFVRRAGQVIQQYMAATGYEACGRFEYRGTGWVIALTSNGAHVGCVLPDPLTGNDSRLGTLHGHPMGLTYRCNYADGVLSGQRCQQGKRGYRVVETPSAADLSVGMGYLVIGDEVRQYQRGMPIRLVVRLDDSLSQGLALGTGQEIR